MKTEIKEFSEYIRMIYCLSAGEFELCFGNELGAHLLRKLKEEYKNDVGKWLCYLDLGNERELIKYLNCKIQRRKEKAVYE